MRKRKQKLVGPGGYVPAVTDVVVLGDYKIRVTFSDGAVRDVDLGPMELRNLTEPWRDHAYFARVYVDPDLETIAWPNGFDIDPCWLYDGGFERSNSASR